jgi:tRNA A37 threonylcarbamoyladenosine biosynthesis protein TsaE
VHSPSYIYINTYEGDIRINHIDLYLLNEYSDINHIGYDELEGEELCLIEWGDKFPEIISEDKWNLHIAYKRDQSRVITISLPADEKALEERIFKLWHI